MNQAEVEAGAGANAESRPLKLLIPSLVLVVYWIIKFASHHYEMGMLPRFLTSASSLLCLTLFFLVWWLTRKHFTRLQRFLVMLGFGVSFVLAAVLVETNTSVPLIFWGVPIMFTICILWLWVAKYATPASKSAGLVACMAAVFGIFLVFRTDGLDGRQLPVLAWRWTLSPEAAFLKEHSANTIQQSQQPVEPNRRILVGKNDVTEFRGGATDATIANTVLGDWGAHPPVEKWRRRVGPAWSSVIVVDNFLFTQEQRDKQECVVCYNKLDGTEIWSTSSARGDIRFDEPLSGIGPRATPVFSNDRIFAFGALGNLMCLEAVSGERVWERNVFEETEATVPQWGSASSPLIVGNHVVVFAGGKDGKALMAYRVNDGAPEWSAPGGTISYASPTLISLVGEEQIVMQDDKGLYGLDRQDGTRLWDFPSKTTVNQPMVQPHRLNDDSLLVGWGNGMIRLQFSKQNDVWEAKEVWQTNFMKPGFNDVVIFEQVIFGLDDGILACVDLDNGNRKWKRGRYGFGQLLLIKDSKDLLVLSETGEMIRVEADSSQHRERGRFEAIHGKTWNHPVLSGDLLFVRNSEEMACFQVNVQSSAQVVASNMSD